MEEKKELIKYIIENNSSPLLTDLLKGKDIDNSFILPATINKEELVGYYQNNKYYQPKWMNEMMDNKNNIILVIDKIDEISMVEQDKFFELIKYRKISTFKIDDFYRIILTAKDLNKVSENIKKLVITIGGK